MSLRNVVVMPPRIRAYLGDDRLLVHADMYVRDDELLMIDGDGHVHAFKWLGRLIDHAAPVEGDEEEAA